MSFPDPPEPSAALPGADWFPDPERPGRLRYWDGTDWTDHHVNESGAPTDIGDWLGRTFKVLWQHKTAAAVLISLPLLLWIPALLFGRVGIADARLDDVDDFAESLSTGPLIVAGVLAVLGIFVTIGSYLGLAHQFLIGHQGGSASIGSSLRRGWARLPAAILWSLLVYATSFLIIGLLITAATQVPLLFVAVIPLVLAMAAWLYVRFGFLPVSSVAAPSVSEIPKASMSVSKGHFWSVLGRILLIALIGGAIGFVVQTIVNQVILTTTLGSFEFANVDGEADQASDVILYKGEPIGDQRLGNVLPGGIGTAIIGALYYLSNFVGSVMVLSGLVGLYSDARAPSETEGVDIV